MRAVDIIERHARLTNKSLLIEKEVSFIEAKVVKISEVARADFFQSLMPR
jgi:hypothetical protein